MRRAWLMPVSLAVVSLLVAAAQDTMPPPPPKAPPSPPQEEFVYVLMTTSKGEILLELDKQKAPITVANFIAYTDKEFYDGTIFHRVIKDFMIQGGGFQPGMVQKKVEKPIANEWKNGLKNKRGTIAMARLGGQADSATAQFFINVKDNDALDTPRDGAAYAVFGKVVAGMKAVDAIRAVPTSPRGGHGDVPVDDVVIQKARRIEAADAKKRIDAEKAPAGKPG
jgi:cyclophilin family peptidyl-prolyl cis-trans isomerase